MARRDVHPPEERAPAADAASPDDAHIDKVARAVQRLLGKQAQPRLSRRLRDWPQVLDAAEDICQLAALAFISAYRQGRIAPDALAGEHTARSVAAYAWGICNRIFANALRRSKPQTAELFEEATGDGGDGASASRPGRSRLEELLGDGPGDSEGRLWEVLCCVEGRCRPEDIIVTYLLASGVTVAEVRQLLDVSTNTPANALRRVGHELRSALGLSSGAVTGARPGGTEAAATGSPGGPQP